MALNRDAIGKKIGPLTKTYDWKDLVLYALGVGAGFDELDYTYEKNLKALPSFSIAAVFEFFGQAALASNLNLAGVLHGEQELIFHRPIPTAGTLTTEGQITHYYDKGPKGALVVAESATAHSNGETLFTSILTLFARLDGGFGGEAAPSRTITFPDREPDFCVAATPSPSQPLLYRLSGDIFPLHVDPEFARMAGFDRPIMHGLCTHGFACRALIASLIPGKPELARRLACRFSKTLYPGDPIRTQIWKTGAGEALWRTVNVRTGETVIDHGLFAYGERAEGAIRNAGRAAVANGVQTAEAEPAAPSEKAARGTVASVESVFAKMPQVFRAEKAAGIHCTFQYTITGEGGGEWFAEVKDGTCRIETGKHLDPGCTLIIAAADFLALMNGTLPALEAFTSGKLKIEGDLIKAQLIGKLFKM
ncbi:MAG: MaoC/PaaZ C-terminal domain-containing protein [Deltaproteobacteria bacterium]|nr:MaoC/PaaZ C-terminal domain-containing protein [Deltaproteobacteria bacterium]